MATMRVRGELLDTDDSSAADPDKFDKSVTYTQKEKKKYVLAPGARQIIWDPTDELSEATSDFDFMMLKSDAEVDIQFTKAKSASGVARFSFRLLAGMPLFLGADDTFGTLSVTATSTASVIQNIDYLVAVNRTANSTTANLTMVLAT